ncbi:type II toxin-antitoxin system RelE/ParE family toxin [Mycoplasmatota bacterium]|nr:type II toxin-antitoxin system RelE/ParE family toxin [Mycoplasmatota bacterium]
MHKLRLNPLAKQDLIDIKEYILTEFDNPSAAANVIKSIIKSYEKLKEFPMFGALLSSKIDIKSDYKYLISGEYIIFYKVENPYVSIYRILSYRRDYIKILFKEV